jgi:hypothetical protein
LVKAPTPEAFWQELEVYRENLREEVGRAGDQRQRQQELNRLALTLQESCF